MTVELLAAGCRLPTAVDVEGMVVALATATGGKCFGRFNKCNREGKETQGKAHKRRVREREREGIELPARAPVYVHKRQRKCTAYVYFPPALNQVQCQESIITR
jgi:hypothetical protein